jgi:CheY-like chemotaxis protein
MNMRTWLVVEDEPDLYDMVLAMYNVLGVDGIAFATGEEAVEWIEEVESGVSEEEIPELGLLDIRLPGDINGLQVGERIRKTQEIKDMVVILMTAFQMSPQEEKEALSQTGADMLLYKPLPQIEKFEKIVQDLFDSRDNNGQVSVDDQDDQDIQGDHDSIDNLAGVDDHDGLDSMDDQDDQDIQGDHDSIDNLTGVDDHDDQDSVDNHDDQDNSLWSRWRRWRR